MKRDVFDHDNYKKYLGFVLRSRAKEGRGYQSRMAEAASCRAAYISQVLNGEAHLSPEQAEGLNELLGHNQEEANYFLLLVHHGRAGTAALRARLKDQVTAAREKRLVLKDRVDIKAELSPADQATYYSAWYYAAVHILVTIPAYQSRDAIEGYVRLPRPRLNEVLDFLRAVGLVKVEGERVTPGVSRIFLGNDSPMITRHHTNWRVRAMESLDRDFKHDLHFSTVVSIAAEDALKMKELLVKSIESARAVATRSTQETELQCLCVDLFRV